MSKLDDKFISAIEEIKECFVVVQAMAKSSIKVVEENERLREAAKSALFQIREWTASSHAKAEEILDQALRDGRK